MFAALLCTLLIAGAVRCFNPFAPALHQGPEDELIVTEQRTPEEVLQNFRYAYTFKDSLLYANVLDSSFVFVFFDPNQGSSGLFMSWGRDVDLKTTGRMFRSFDVIDLTWNSTIYAFEEENTAELSKSFSINFSGAFAEFRVSGTAIFSFKRCTHDNKWRITRWKDESEY